MVNKLPYFFKWKKSIITLLAALCKIPIPFWIIELIDPNMDQNSLTLLNNNHSVMINNFWLHFQMLLHVVRKRCTPLYRIRRVLLLLSCKPHFYKVIARENFKHHQNNVMNIGFSFQISWIYKQKLLIQNLQLIQRWKKNMVRD